MPKITQDIEETNEEDSEDQFDEEELEEQEAPVKKQVPAGLKAYQDRKRLAQQRQMPQQMQKAQPQAPKRRYGIVPAQPVRIVDTEAEEVVAEGDYLIAQALADIIERLERIENTIGTMIGGN